MLFTNLKLQGFKSFVEPTELEIRSGLTGIVGPNGCGKSNLVEALRWVMGETSARRMRGTDMDDVIFAGTALRPSRNLAEVALTLDNSDRSATAEHNNEEELRIARRIERGSGSDYRINGKPARQRDVQLLFADQATGAHSTSVVGQGQIDALIRAKPQDRRQILEEASGTAGLHTRRHEAELKLKAAEQNLSRVDEVLNTLDAQLRGLKQQARQASRYRNLADHIRNTESVLLRLKWQEAEAGAAQAAAAYAETQTRAVDLTGIVAASTTARVEIAAGLPDLRQAEAAAAAIVQRLTLERERIDGEIRRIEGEIRSCEQRLAQAHADAEREQARRSDGESALARLDEETGRLAASEDAARAALPAAIEAEEKAAAEAAAMDAALAELTEQAAKAEAQAQALQQEAEGLSRRRAELSSRSEQAAAQKAALIAEAASRPDLSLATAMVSACETELERRQAQAREAEQALRDAEAAQHSRREASQQAESALTKIKAEADAIASLLRHHDENGAAGQVIDLIAVEPGLEGALAVALGEALSAALDDKAAMHWREVRLSDDDAALPDGASPLAAHIRAPAALARGLSQIGLVESREQGEALAQVLKAGQVIVSRDGWAWRWDGFTVTPQAKTATALRLQQRNRLDALRREAEIAEAAAAAAKSASDSASEILAQCRALDEEARESLRLAFRALDDARALNARQERDAAANNSRLAAVEESLRQLEEDARQADARIAAVAEMLEGLADVASMRLDISSRRAALAELRGQYAQRKSERDHLTREAQSCASRREAAAREIAEWRERMATAMAHADALAERVAELETALSQSRSRPSELASERSKLLDDLSAAEAARRDASDALVVAESALETAEARLRHDESEFNRAREDGIRAEAAVAAAAEHFSALRERIAEKLNCGAEELLAQAGDGDDKELRDAAELEQLLARYLRERDNMGAVNLRADVEAEAMQAGIDKLQKEKDDLTSAISRLRHGIGQLNREARERLQGAFSAVNERFQSLFTGLFGGGKAHLELIDNEDPMNAGLEIFASPPGKKMQVLSLLSGGERTLTALALLFAVFQTNPSPICVLDEAEAALDESNIGRFCDLVERISRETGTRFLIITHQRLTMARMDRLYGVTMGEKGVSQLVSVDLAAAVAMRDGGVVAEKSVLEEGAEQYAAASAALADVQAA